MHDEVLAIIGLFIVCMHQCRVVYIYIYIYIIMCIVSGEIQLILDNTTSELIVNEDVGDIIILVSLSEVLPQQFAANYRLVSGTASEESFMISCVYACM